MEPGAVSLEVLLDRVARLREEGDLRPQATEPGAATEPAASALAAILSDRQLRPEHRARIYAGLASSRELLLEKRDPRLLDLVFWSEHVDSLHTALKRGRLGTFHYTRALEATCRRSGFELLPVVGRIEELGRAWGGGDFAAAYEMLSADVVEVDPPGEAAQELGA